MPASTSPSSSGDTTDIELTITDSIDADVLNAFTGWAAGLPLLEEATPLGATITVSAGPGSGDLTLTISTQFGFSDYTPDELAAALRSALPDGGFSIDVGNDAGSGTHAQRCGTSRWRTWPSRSAPTRRPRRR